MNAWLLGAAAIGAYFWFAEDGGPGNQQGSTQPGGSGNDDQTGTPTRTTNGSTGGEEWPPDDRQVEGVSDSPDLIVGEGLPDQGVVMPETGRKKPDNEATEWADQVAGF